MSLKKHAETQQTPTLNKCTIFVDCCSLTPIKPHFFPQQICSIFKRETCDHLVKSILCVSMLKVPLRVYVGVIGH